MGDLETPTLVITRGLPGSGKTTWAQAWVEDGERRARVNRDDLRHTLYGKYWPLTPHEERSVSYAQEAAVKALLAAKRSVVVDDTNLRSRTAKGWANIARDLGVNFAHVDLLEVPVDECVRRAQKRTDQGGREVAESVIRDMAQKYLHKPLGPVVATEVRPGDGGALYEPDESLPDAWIVDIDGTLAKMVDRSPYDYTKVSEDEPHDHIIDLVHALRGRGMSIILMSGRPESCRIDTTLWLRRHGVSFKELWMRATGDGRNDSIVKRELFDKHVRHEFNVRGVLDDRDRVVALWRSMGIPCLQVAEGAF